MHLLTFIYYDLKQSLFDFSSLLYLFILPVGFYLLFGVMQDYSDFPIGEGNMAAYVMLGMAVYGAASGATSAASTVIVEVTSGWGRQLALTPLSPRQLLASRLVRALASGGLPVVAVNLVALLTPVKIPPGQQILCALVTIATASIFFFFGSAVALIFRSVHAASVAAGAVVIFCFFGTALSPLPDSLLSSARLTPLYGVAQLSRYIFTGGDTVARGTDSWYVAEPLHYAVINFVCWALIFIGSTLLLRRRTTAR